MADGHPEVSIRLQASKSRPRSGVARIHLRMDDMLHAAWRGSGCQGISNVGGIRGQPMASKLATPDQATFVSDALQHPKTRQENNDTTSTVPFPHFLTCPALNPNPKCLSISFLDENGPWRHYN